jgi:uncharacterized membrane protein YfcA
MEFVVIAIIAFIASGLTFFSGFGLGTLLLPAFSFFFPVQVAIALTAIVHFLNNIFKLLLVGRQAKWNVVLKFGLAAILAAFIGAWLMGGLINQPVLTSYVLFGKTFQILWIKVIIAAVMISFTLFEIVPALQRLQFDEKYLPVGGFLSGFFGGLSGHQGALRSAFLLRLKLSKEAFIGTGVVIACFIDIARFVVYLKSMDAAMINDKASLLFVAVAAAFVGAYLGNRFLKKMKIEVLQKVVALMLILFSFAMALGFV